MTIRPGTRDVWIGDVGGGSWEEINRVPDGGAGVLYNFGWPCYEGSPRHGGFDAADLAICENLYAQPGAVTQPLLAYHHSQKVVPSETCPTSTGSAVSGLAFTPANSPYPAAYDGALFFADYSRQCIWVMYAGTERSSPIRRTSSHSSRTRCSPSTSSSGRTESSTTWTSQPARSGGSRSRLATSRRWRVATASPTSGPVPLAVNFNGSGSSDPDGTIVGTHGISTVTGSSTTRARRARPVTYTTVATYSVRLRVTDNQGAPALSSPI